MRIQLSVLALISIMLHMGALAQVQDESTAPAHERHLHRHNPDHPTSDDPSRFFTDRASAISLPLPGEEEAFTFVVYGDRTGGPDAGINILKDAVRDTNLLEPDFVMTVGDMIDGYNQTDAWMEQMREFKGVMDELICPWFPVAGNHDTYWRGDNRPPSEHDEHYEMHFGPLWYAFEHKGSMFIVLYTDEGDQDTGEKNFRKPECQEMSDEQLAWLAGMLDEAQDAQHVFLFLHHPRWLGGNYGDSWDQVHEMLVEAGNVSGVFAGHIHRMRYDPRDGIEYVTLATVGGHQNKIAPDFGWLHHYNIVTVRPNQIAHAAIPVGQVMDVREITGELADESRRLIREGVIVSAPIVLSASEGCEGRTHVELSNPTSHTVEFVVTPDSRDSRWSAWPDHTHGSLEPGESCTLAFDTKRTGALDETYRDLAFAVDLEMLLPGNRYRIPTVSALIPIELDLDDVHIEESARALSLDGSSHASVPDHAFELHDGAITLECWFNADSFARRTGLLAKTENSEYGFFVNSGVPSFSIHLDGSYAEAKARDFVLEKGTWHHLAGVYDESEVRLYVNGKLESSIQHTGKRTRNTFPLMIGSDVDSMGRPTSHFQGTIDDVRVSSVARYEGSSFEPSRDWEADEDAVLLLDMDSELGPWVIDQSKSGAHAKKSKNAKLE